jgi:glycerol-3-phosphate dehydrogenase
LAERLGGTDTVMAEVTYAVEREMAIRLTDVVLRRTNLGSGSHPGQEAMSLAARGMQQLLSWTDEHRDAQIADTERTLRHHRAAVPAMNGASP